MAFIDKETIGDEMADAKLEIKVGAVTFSGEGAENWLSQQLDKVLQQLPELMQVRPNHSDGSHDAHEAGNPPKLPHPSAHKHSNSTLAAYIKDKKATGNQARKFLATAQWLHDAEKKYRLTTREVSDTLNKYNQGKLTNPAQCLANNTKSGWTVKDGKTFYVSEEGKAALDK